MQERHLLSEGTVNPAALYIRQSSVRVAAPVPNIPTSSHDESGTISTKIWDITTHTSVFALRVALAVVSQAQDQVLFDPVIADEVSVAVRYSNGASAVARLGCNNVGDGLAVAKMESCTTNRRIDAHMAVAPLPPPGDVHICLAMGDGSRLGEWLLSGKSILEASRRVMGCEQA